MKKLILVGLVGTVGLVGLTGCAAMENLAKWCIKPEVLEEVKTIHNELKGAENEPMQGQM